MLPVKKIKELKKELDSCENPLFIHDNDCDGLCSFLLLLKYKKAGNGIFMKTKTVDHSMLEEVKQYEFDKVFILDVPNIAQDFVDEIHVPIIQVDHHPSEHPKGIKIFNPLDYNPKDNSPTTSMCYKVVKQNEWLCAIGTIADWHLTKDTLAFAKKNKKLLNPKFKTAPEALFDSEVGKLARVFNFMLKGKTSEAKENVELLKKIKTPKEILEQTTKEGKAVHKRYKELLKPYQELYNRAEKYIKKDKLAVFTYESDEAGFNQDLSNELIHRHPDKIIVIARKVRDEYRCSLRSATIPIRDILQKALTYVEGTGGGHTHACGANIKVRDFDEFLEIFKEQF